MAGVVGQATVEELGERFRAAKDVVERSHCQVIRLLAKGHSTAEITEIVALSPRWVSKLARRYAAEGVGALGDRRRGNVGARPLLSGEDLEALRERLKTPPDDGGLWSGPKVARWMAARLGLVHVHPPRGWEALKRIGWSIQAPLPRNPKAAGAEEQSAFKRSSARWSPRSGRRPTCRALGDRRAPARLEAGAAPGLGADLRAARGARPPPLRMALRHHLRRAAEQRDRLVPLRLHRQAALRDDARRLRARDRRRARPGRRPPARRRRLAHRAEPRRSRGRQARLPFSGNPSTGRFSCPSNPYTPELQPAEHLWPLVDEPVASRYFETLRDLDTVLAERCRTLCDDRATIAANTRFNWWPRTSSPT
ncbi:MAG TPA: helix-turn-helix domain-containing protein [Amaricoccus sp.]|uniref:helix-turn-helix domain-containing protein n=1 Tax=Amaricoccus sp. TaxID=1872485 RepID=UPI002BA0B198|nr:helix-turn-helix domain-containing protein [Amaricoccus sp.]HMQ94681.1 helix-turn-helix domain-containing protein [Amaricoccus sp.]HMR37590.1 helix-turn-helix domain-containing protein [Paracoccus sp. (in: a-proteobacteria)]HMR53288.1 helix-turn-helix domain-containing protein [Amaricoccus sp.]HMU00249.1 helix-turn-helix domain-containing protein [Amaricoccus sp.]